MKIGDKLRGLRNEHGLSVATLADKLEISESTYRRLETDKHFPSLDLLDKICRCYQIKLLRLLPPELLQSHKDDSADLMQNEKNSKLSKKLIKQYEARIEDLQNQLIFRNIITKS